MLNTCSLKKTILIFSEHCCLLKMLAKSKNDGQINKMCKNDTVNPS